MATLFLEPSGDATFNVATPPNGGFWSALSNAPAVATDFVHGTHIKSVQYAINTIEYAVTPAATCADAGTRASFYFYKVANSGAIVIIADFLNSGSSEVFALRVTSAGVLRVYNATPTQLGTSGPTLANGVWYRISVSYTITDTTHNRIEVFVDGVSAISITNATLTIVSTDRFRIGNVNGNATLDFRSSDHYIDDSSSLTDTGDIWVTAKRPNANGTTNGFTTQIGVGGSGYGSGHSPQVNERPLSTTNGWSVVGAGSAVTEEYNIEGKSVGDINISTATIIDYMGWVSGSSVTNETASIIVNNVASNISLTNTSAVIKKIAGSSTYPAGTGTDIGVVTDTTLTTVGLYECGVVVAFIPGAPAVVSTSNLTTLNCG